MINWPKNTNSVEDVDDLLSVKFHQIVLNGEVQNVSANQRPALSSLLTDQPKQHVLGREH